MTPEEHRSLRESLGALALGHLPEAEAAAVRRHLATCAACRAELAEIAPVAERLRSVDWARAGSAAEPPPGFDARVMEALRREARAAGARRLSRRVAAGLAAAAAFVAVAGVGAVAGRVGAPDVVAAPRVPFEPVAVRTAVPGIEASAGIVPHTWGVEIKLTAAGFEQGAPYAVYVTTADGRRRTAGAFVGTGAKELRCNLNADVLRPDAAAFAVVDARGRTVLSAALPLPT